MDKITSACFDLTSYQTDYLRPIPIIFNSDFQWDDNMAINNVQWNYSLEVNHDKVSQVREIIQNTCTTEISDEEQKILFNYLQNEKDLLKNCGFTCQRLPSIIEKNKEIAHFLLISICHFDGFEEYFDLILSSRYLDVFIQSDITQNSLELFAQLFGELKLPLEYITQYINYCIEYCNNIKEKQQQNKLVRYVSIFIQHMLKQKAFALKDVLTNLQAFCIEFSKVGEVSKLFKLVKAQEATTL